MARAVQDLQTRQRLIEVATRQFAEHGFRRVTVRTISRDARANVAAVNYHFRNKLGLYREVLDQAVLAVRETTDLVIQAGAGQPPEEQLRLYIRIHLERLMASDMTSVFQQLMHREMNEPTDLLKRMVDQMIRPRFEYLFAVVGEVVGRPPTDPAVQLSALSIHALVLMFKPNPMGEIVARRLKLDFTPDQIVEHVTAFALAGLRPYRSRPV